MDQAAATPPIQDDASSEDASLATQVGDDAAGAGTADDAADAPGAADEEAKAAAPTCNEIECPDGQYCDPILSHPACRPLRAEGMDCMGHYECQEYLFCETWANLPKCRKAPGKGGDCEMTSGICAEGFYCDLLEYPAICKHPGKAGKPCCGDQACAKGLYCDTQAPEQSTCKPLTTQECDFEAEVSCPEGQFCDEEHLAPLCLPLGTVGQHCANDSQCKQGLTCSRDPENYRDLCTAPK